MQNCLSHCLLLLFEIIFGIINEMVRTFYRDTEQVASFLFVWTILSAYIIFEVAAGGARRQPTRITSASSHRRMIDGSLPAAPKASASGPRREGFAPAAAADRSQQT